MSKCFPCFGSEDEDLFMGGAGLYERITQRLQNVAAGIRGCLRMIRDRILSILGVGRRRFDDQQDNVDVESSASSASVSTNDTDGVTNWINSNSLTDLFTENEHVLSSRSSILQSHGDHDSVLEENRWKKTEESGCNPPTAKYAQVAGNTSPKRQKSVEKIDQSGVANDTLHQNVNELPVRKENDSSDATVVQCKQNILGSKTQRSPSEPEHKPDEAESTVSSPDNLASKQFTTNTDRTPQQDQTHSGNKEIASTGSQCEQKVSTEVEATGDNLDKQQNVHSQQSVNDEIAKNSTSQYVKVDTSNKLKISLVDLPKIKQEDVEEVYRTYKAIWQVANIAISIKQGENKDAKECEQKTDMEAKPSLEPTRVSGTEDCRQPSIHITDKKDIPTAKSKAGKECSNQTPRTKGEVIKHPNDKQSTIRGPNKDGIECNQGCPSNNTTKTKAVFAELAQLESRERIIKLTRAETEVKDEVITDPAKECPENKPSYSRVLPGDHDYSESVIPDNLEEQEEYSSDSDEEDSDEDDDEDYDNENGDLDDENVDQEDRSILATAQGGKKRVARKRPTRRAIGIFQDNGNFELATHYRMDDHIDTERAKRGTKASGITKVKHKRRGVPNKHLQPQRNKRWMNISTGSSPVPSPKATQSSESLKKTTGNGDHVSQSGDAKDEIVVVQKEDVRHFEAIPEIVIKKKGDDEADEDLVNKYKTPQKDKNATKDEKRAIRRRSKSSNALVLHIACKRRA